MMAYLNEVNLIGNVGRNPEVRTTQDGTKMASFSLATTKKWKKDGKPNERTEWHRIKVFGPKAKVVEQYVEKGDLLLVRGELRLDDFTDQDGTNWKVSEVILKDFEFLSPKKGREDVADLAGEDERADAAA